MNRLLLGLSLVTAFLVAGCNTASGLGQDIQAGGQKLERSAERNK